MGSRKGSWLGTVGVVSSLTVLVIWAGIWLWATSNSSGRRTAGTSEEYFRYFVASDPTLDMLVVVAMVGILVFSYAGIVLKSPGGAVREASADEPERLENEQK